MRGGGMTGAPNEAHTMPIPSFTGLLRQRPGHAPPCLVLMTCHQVPGHPEPQRNSLDPQRRGGRRFLVRISSELKVLKVPWGGHSPLRVTGMMVTARVANLGRAQRAPLEMRAAGEKNTSF